MNEIKFKVWDEYQKKFVPVTDVVIDGNGKISIVNLKSDIRKVEDLKILLYTGLRDKKGTKIYEDDIVKVHSRYERKYVTAVVKWGCGYGEVGFSLRQLYDCLSKKYEGWELYDEMGSNFTFDRDLEIIGNIYENPELIKNV